MTQVVLAAKAADDFLAIVADLIVLAGLGTAASYDTKLKRLLARLSTHPESGSPRPQLGLGIRAVVMSSYIVFYTYDEVKDVGEHRPHSASTPADGTSRTQPPLS